MTGTEDDTFRILAKPCIHKMTALWVNETVLKKRRGRNLDLAAFCQKHGWDWSEFLKAKHEAGYDRF